MNTLLSARKRAEEFDALLSGRPSAAARPDLTELAGVVTSLREHTPVAPRPDFSASLREQLMAEAATVLTSEAKRLVLPARRPGAHQRRLVAAATAAVFVGGTAGMAAASQNALPGDALYPIKRTLERAQAELNTNGAGKGHDLLAQAEDRLVEAEKLMTEQGAAATQVPSTIEEFSRQAEQGSALLVAAFQDSRDPDSLVTVRSFAARSLAVLQELAKTAQPQAQEALASAAQLLQSIDQQALGLCGACASDLPPLQIADLLNASSPIDAIAETVTIKAKPKTKQAPASQPTAPQVNEQLPAATPKSTEVAPKKATLSNRVRKTTTTVGQTLDDTLQPLSDVLDSLLPGTGAVLDDVTGPLAPPSTPTR